MFVLGQGNDNNRQFGFNEEPHEAIAYALKQSIAIEEDNITEAIEYAQLALELSEKHEYSNELMQSLNLLSNLYFSASYYKEALESAKRLMVIATQNRNEKMIGSALIRIGSVYGELGVYDNSADYFFNSLKLFEKIKDEKGIAESLGAIGNLFNTQKQHEKAIDYLTKALDKARETDDLNLISKQLNNISIIQYNLKNYDSAIAYLKESLYIDEQLGNKFNQGIKNYNLGFYELKEMNYEESYYHLNKALKLYSEVGNQLHIATCYLALGQYYYERDSIDKCITPLYEALNRGKENNYYKVIYQAAKGLHMIHLLKNDTLNAYKYSTIEKTAQDSLFISQNQIHITRLELQYNFEKERLEKQLAEQAKNSFYLIVFICLVLGLIILSLLYSRHRLKAKKIDLEKQAVQKELKFKSKELTINIMALMKKSEMLAEISSNLIEISKGAKTAETKDALRKIDQKIKHSSADRIMKEFSKRFQEVHEEFYQTLLEKYPYLSQNELKLCAFLRLNMSTKEISEMTGQRIITIENARYRLRKKLELSNVNTNLVAFLSQF